MAIINILFLNVGNLLWCNYRYCQYKEEKDSSYRQYLNYFNNKNHIDIPLEHKMNYPIQST